MQKKFLRKRIVIWIKTNMKFFFRTIFISAIVFSAALPAMERAQQQYVKTRVQKRRQTEEIVRVEGIESQKKMKRTNTVVVKKEKEICPICWDDLKKQKYKALACFETHRFHVKCLGKWHKKSQQCPFGCALVAEQGEELPLVPIRIGTWKRYLPSMVFGAIVLISLASSQGPSGYSANHTFI